MADTAQPFAAAETDPNAQLANAADAFKAFTQDRPIQPRAENGQFASTQPDETEEPAPEGVEADEAEYDDEGELEAEEAAEEPAQPMPPSWPEDKADVWNTLPAETQAFIAERDAEQLRATNAKFQEAANARKAHEAKVQEAASRLEDFNRVVATAEAMYRSPEPDPRAFGYGTQQFNQAAYNVAYQQWQQTETVLAQLQQQQATLTKQQTEAEAATRAEWKREHEAQYAPKFVADVPDLTDPAKAEPLMRGLVDYAINNGLPSELFAEDNQQNITSAELHLLWKAQEYDRLRAARPKVEAKPRPAGPVVKPGVSSPRSATKAARRNKDFERLSREGSVDAGAAVFKHFLR